MIKLCSICALSALICIGAACSTSLKALYTLEDGDEINVVGRAIDAKAGAMVQLNNGISFYIDDLLAWPSDVLNRKVRVKGNLTVMEYQPPKDSIVFTQSIGGRKESISNASYKLLGNCSFIQVPN